MVMEVCVDTIRMYIWWYVRTYGYGHMGMQMQVCGMAVRWFVRVCVCVTGGDTILKRKACMGPGVGTQRRGPVPKRMSDENHHDCTGPP